MIRRSILPKHVLYSKIDIFNDVAKIIQYETIFRREKLQ